MKQIKCLDIREMVQDEFYEEDEHKSKNYDCDVAVFNILKALYGEPVDRCFEVDENVLSTIIQNICKAYVDGACEARDRAIREVRNFESQIMKAIEPLY